MCASPLLESFIMSMIQSVSAIDLQFIHQAVIHLESNEIELSMTRTYNQ